MLLNSIKGLGQLASKVHPHLQRPNGLFSKSLSTTNKEYRYNIVSNKNNKKNLNSFLISQISQF